MATQISVLSVSRGVREWLPAQPAPGRVLAVFARTCLLSSEGGKLLSLVPPEVGDGPLNVVVVGQVDAFGGVEPGTPASLSRDRLRLGALELVLDGACTWEPRPDWLALRAAGPVAQGRLRQVRLAAMRQAPEGSLLALFGGGSAPRTAAQRHVLDEACAAAGALADGWAGEEHALGHGARRLAGLGGGLTPAGDDFLVGLMLYAWLAHPEPAAFCQGVVAAAMPRTTAVSAAFLRAAARGGCSAAWHGLLAALAGDGPGSLDDAVCGILAHGHTSGADMLAGFLWMPGHDQPADPSAC
jgi:hypothetical protein